MITNNELEKFYRGIKRNIVCPSYEKNAFLGDLRHRIGEFCEANPDAELDDIKKAFGEPKAIAEGFESKQDIATLRKYAKRARIYKILLICVIVICAALLAYFTVTAVNALLGLDVRVTITGDGVIYH